MTNRELIDILLKYPADSIVMYRHNRYGRIDVDYVDFTEETTLIGNKQHFVTLEGVNEEDHSDDVF